MISAVLDANIIASGILGFRNPDSIPGVLLRLWRKGIFALVTSKHLRDEVRDTLHKPYFTTHLSPQEISRIQALLQFQTKQVLITENVPDIATHPEDDLVIAAAVSGKVDYLVTGDGPLLRKVSKYKGVTLISPNDFLEVLKKQI
ncbi:putative toxin-antitoxin system toxin component, PIN family [Candidatus Daviesbacteria bacterium RIFCSPLOWO2_01_FULL_39_12]|uniref:Putative toxin-antitoxin system toxin component, PIN family n=1 Tax=Candidatus Daviesbacteria bacterium RIFCSPLOWO2_01_FULL_39_12 TaxID=1797785 RepID=A0A1F5KSE0_9BACT|nr:MAG: putative toxin-antitoxin system toxin component, PIN family [Candidatus Daviesbacteria bacterium RIFCSPHIGHO2_02_FULL_39_8]OGE43832.1 MAG: putative toxin-antitoxin system toxin component, PIN family [Candidatus Daviesbacteria bacterium RIFCSPLOWO2_01_FULL_39_12]